MVQAASESVFSFEGAGHEVLEVSGAAGSFKFVQWQPHEISYQNGKAKVVALPLSKTPPILFSFWGGQVATRQQIMDCLGRSNLVLVDNHTTA